MHAQVPVDVSSFLLNEKRAEIQKLEARLKVNIVLVPNPHLETPHYKVQRLKHDELNAMEHVPSSYELVERPEEPKAPGATEEEKVERQQPVVKSITPDQPAPLPQAPRARSRFNNRWPQPQYRKRNRLPRPADSSAAFSARCSASRLPQPRPHPQRRRRRSPRNRRSAIRAATSTGATAGSSRITAAGMAVAATADVTVAARAAATSTAIASSNRGWSSAAMDSSSVASA